jgi:hypothetical protein
MKLVYILIKDNQIVMEGTKAQVKKAHKRTPDSQVWIKSQRPLLRRKGTQ